MVTMESSHPDLLKLVHPSQLEKKFGGEIENLTCFWPPTVFSNEFGHDPNMIRECNSDDLSIGSITVPLSKK